MYIIPVDSYEAMYEANENQSVTNSMDRIAELTYALPEPAPASGYPVLPTAPYTPAIGANDLAVQVGRASADEQSASKNGFRLSAVGRRMPTRYLTRICFMSTRDSVMMANTW